MIPIFIGIVDGNLLTRRNTFGDEYDTLDTKPEEAFILRIGLATMVDEASIVHLMTLKNLIVPAGPELCITLISRSPLVIKPINSPIAAPRSNGYKERVSGNGAAQ